MMGSERHSPAQVTDSILRFAMDLQGEGQQGSWNCSTFLPLQAESQRAGKKQGLLVQISADSIFPKQPLGLFEAPEHELCFLLSTHRALGYSLGSADLEGADLSGRTGNKDNSVGGGSSS